MTTTRRLRPDVRTVSAVVWLLAVLGCTQPAPFELSPIDPGTDSFEFPPEDLKVIGGGPDNVVLVWSVRTSTATEFILDRGVDDGPLTQVQRLPGATRVWMDVSIAPVHTYLYRIVSLGPAGQSAPASIRIEWTMQLVNQSDELALSTSDSIVGLAMTEQIELTRVLSAQANGRLLLHAHNGVNFNLAATRTLAQTPNGITMSPTGTDAAATAESTVTFLGSTLAVRSVVRSAAGVRSPSFASTGFRLLTGGTDGVLRIWRTSDGVLVDSIVVSVDPILECAYNRTGSVIGALSADGTVRFYRVSDLTLISTVVVPGGQRLSLEDTGLWAVVARPSSGSARVIRVADGGSVSEISGGTTLRQAFFVQASACVLLIGGQPNVRLHDVSRGRDLALPGGVPQRAVHAAVGEFGRRFVFSEGRGSLMLWSAETGWVGGR